MRARPLLALGSWALGVAAACAPAAPKAARVPPPAASAKPAPVPSDPATRLASLLRAVARPGPVLDALPAAARSALDARVAGLDAQRKLDARSEEGAFAESMPLLHLASGGSSPRALYALAATAAGSSELAGLLGADAAGAGSPERARVLLSAELARRAALNFLRDRAADVAAAKPSSLVYRYVAELALAVERRDIALAALEALAFAEPTPDNRLELARARARELDAAGASKLLAEVSRDSKHPPSPLKMRRAARSIELAQLLSAPNGNTTLLQHARALLHLGRLQELRALLAVKPAEVARDLGLAAAQAAAALGGRLCPGLPLGVGSNALCDSALREDPAAQAALGVLEQAWQGRQGRDSEAVEYYVGISRLAALMHLGASELALKVSAAQVSTIAGDLAAAAQEAPELAGVSLFFAAISTSKAQQSASDDALFARALELAKQGGRFNEAGVLAVASVLAHRRDVSPLLDALPAASEPVPARAALDAWLAVTQGKSARMATARNELAEVMGDARGQSFERARLVLTMAEADAVLDGSERTLQLLSRVAGQLLSESIPPDLAFRAVLDTAGALSRGGRRERALEISRDAAAAQVPTELQNVHDLWRLVKGYHRVLASSAAHSSASELAAVGQELAELGAPPIAPSAQLWLELWGHELAARQSEASCPHASASCTAQARKLRRIAKDSIAARVGPQAAPLLERGFLPGGSMNLAFDFSAEEGLEANVSFDPAFLAVELPKFETF